MNPATRAALERALGASVERMASVGGGDINDAYQARLGDGRTVFVKTNERADPTMFPAEARGLSYLAEAKALRVPEVLAVSEGRPSSPSFLALEWLDAAPRMRAFDDVLGQGLAALHRFGASSFGLSYDNFIGRLPQSNRAHATWAAFYGEERLLRELRRATDSGVASAKMRRGIERLVTSLTERVGPPEPPSRLHGDLWGGNLHVDEEGAPVLIDPAVYGGHREIDLAMMQLFGGFSARCFAAYDEAFPLAPGHEDRVPLYQLYPLLVHVNLFGGSYVSSVERTLDAIG